MYFVSVLHLLHLVVVSFLTPFHNVAPFVGKFRMAGERCAMCGQDGAERVTKDDCSRGESVEFWRIAPLQQSLLKCLSVKAT